MENLTAVAVSELSWRTNTTDRLRNYELDLCFVPQYDLLSHSDCRGGTTHSLQKPKTICKRKSPVRLHINPQDVCSSAHDNSNTQLLDVNLQTLLWSSDAHVSVCTDDWSHLLFSGLQEILQLHGCAHGGNALVHGEDGSRGDVDIDLLGTIHWVNKRDKIL